MRLQSWPQKQCDYRSNATTKPERENEITPPRKSQPPERPRANFSRRKSTSRPMKMRRRWEEASPKGTKRKAPLEKADPPSEERRRRQEKSGPAGEKTARPPSEKVNPPSAGGAITLGKSEPPWGNEKTPRLGSRPSEKQRGDKPRKKSTLRDTEG